jgi:hypothetical protein
MKLVVLKIPDVKGTIGPSKLALPVFHTYLVDTFEKRAIWPRLLTIAGNLSIGPMPDILHPSFVNDLPFPMRLSIRQLSLKYITVRVDHSTYWL